jgi:hypothetical protein
MTSLTTSVVAFHGLFAIILVNSLAPGEHIVRTRF